MADPTGIELIYELGHTWTLDELPLRSIALDGAVRGPQLDLEREVYSFDHHDGCLRHATLATCEQVRDALVVGLDPSGFTVFANDVDADTVLSLWLLMHPERLRGSGAARLRRLVERVGRVDALGPAVGVMPPIGRLLTPPDTLLRDRSLLHEKLDLLDCWWHRQSLPRAPRVGAVEAMWVAGEGSSRALRRGRVRQGFAGLYERSDFGVVFTPAPLGTRAYLVGKRSDFVSFDIAAFLAECDRREPGWGGGSTIGGAVRHPDGRRSSLSPDEVGEILLTIAS